MNLLKTCLRLSNLQSFSEIIQIQIGQSYQQRYQVQVSPTDASKIDKMLLSGHDIYKNIFFTKPVHTMSNF